tara:strand:+ start:251 stop:889 length:639 start_codon:yes stop_codon:yes gene_type:complete
MKTILTFIKNKRNILNTLFIPFILYSVFLLIFTIQGVPPLLIIRDLAQTCNQTLGVGFLSNLGIIIWIGISSILIFIIKVGVSKKSKYNDLIKTGCIFSWFLALDDFFLIHDKYIIQEIIFLSYFILIFYILKRFFTQIKELGPNLFLTSLLLFGLSIIIDIVLQDLFPSFLIVTQIIEEGCKFMGIFCWASFWWKSASKILKSQNVITYDL